VVYIGETVEQDLSRRLKQLVGSIGGKTGHGGGERLREKGHRSTDDLWVSVRGFPLGLGDEQETKFFRSAQIRLLERMLLTEYVRAFHQLPKGNFK
jgi:hypothetical protein